MKPQPSPTRTTLIDAAESLFAEKGYHGTAVREIAQRANISTAQISYYFSSKENLYRSIFEFRLFELNEAFSNNKISATANSFEKLESYLQVYIAQVKEHRYFHRLLNTELSILKALPFNRSIIDSLLQNIAIVRHVIREGIDHGEFRAVDVDMFMISLFHLTYQAIIGSPLLMAVLQEEDLIQRVQAFIHQTLQNTQP